MPCATDRKRVRTWKETADGLAYGFVCETVNVSHPDKNMTCGASQLSCWLKANPNRKLAKNPYAFTEEKATGNGTMAATPKPPVTPPKEGALSIPQLTDASRSNTAEIGVIKQVLNAIAAKTGALDNSVGSLQDENGASEVNWPMIGLIGAAILGAIYVWKH